MEGMIRFTVPFRICMYDELKYARVRGMGHMMQKRFYEQ